MDTVSETSMAVAMAALGGIAFVHSNTTPSDQASMILSAKSRRVPVLSNPVFKPPSGRIESFDDFGDSPYILVTDSGTAKSKLLGYVSKLDWQNLKDKEVKIYDYMVNSSVSVPSSFDLEQIDAFLEEKKYNFVPVVNDDDDEVLDLVTKGDVQRIKGYPKLASGSIGSDGKWLLGAAMGTREDDKVRLEHLVKAGVNVVVLDSSQGNSIYQTEMIKYIKSTYPELDVIGGNVVTMYQADNLIQAGVDGLRVGMGSGSICTTQEVCAVGRGQV